MKRLRCYLKGTPISPVVEHTCSKKQIKKLLYNWCKSCRLANIKFSEMCVYEVTNYKGGIEQ